MNKKIKCDYENACNAYLKAFCDKHGYDYEDAARSWVGGDAGSIAEVCDYFVDMTTIRTDIDRDAPKEEFVQWYDYCLRLASVDTSICTPNFENWLRGCPRKSEEEILELERLHKAVEDAKAALMSSIENASISEPKNNKPMGTCKTISEITPCNCSYLEGGFNCLECEFCGGIDVENKDIQCNYEKQQDHEK